MFEPSGRWPPTLESFQKALASYQPLAATVGVLAEHSPLRDPAAHDFRPSENSAARSLGAKVFVPWSLYETVGEWAFNPLPGDPSRILDEHWCLAPYYTGRDDYYKFPTYPLKAVNVTLKDYQDGPLENWTAGALHFNGRDQYAVLANDDITRPVQQLGEQQRTINGADLKNPQIYNSNFLIETYFKTVSGFKGGTLIRKMNDTGFALRIHERGGVTLSAQATGVTVSLAGRGAVNDFDLTQLYDDSSTYAWTGNGETLASSGTNLNVDDRQMVDIRIGTNGGGWTFNAPQYIYWGGFAVCADDWCGPYTTS